MLVTWQAWLVIAAVAAVVEAASMSMVSGWFVVGALAAFTAAYLGAPEWLQVVLFTTVSVTCLVALRPIVMDRRGGNAAVPEKTQVGQRAVVIEKIGGDWRPGRVETHDKMTWLAVSSDGSAIEEGSHVVVVGVDSVKLIVERNGK